MNKTASTPPEKRPIDWEAIERDYRAGIKTLRKIAEDNPGVSHVTIANKAKSFGWTRDLSAKIQAKADELINKAALNKPLNKPGPLSEAKIILENGAQAAAIRIGHRKEIGRLRTIISMLMDELEQSSGPEQAQRLRDLGEMMRTENDGGQDKLNDLYRAVISLPERTKTGKALADTLRIAIDLERREFGMDKVQSATDPLTELIQRINSASGSAFKPVAVDPAYSGDDE